MDSVGERIKTARKAAGMTQFELEKKMGVNGWGYINKYECGVREPKYETLKRIADALSVPVRSLMVGSKQLTKADHIRAMSDEELAEWLADMWDCHDCSEHERLGDHPLLSDEHCDQKCKEHCLEWLKQPVENVD